MKGTGFTKFGAFFLILAIIGFIVVEFIVAMSWKEPRYNYLVNTISDLGVEGQIVTSSGAIIHSPLANVMNKMFIIFGIVYFVCFGLILLSIDVDHKVFPYIFLTISSLGLVCLGIFPKVQEGAVDAHVISSILAIGGAGFTVLTSGFVIKRRYKGVGLLAFLTFVACVVSAYFLLFNNNGNRGLFERICVYVLFLFMIILSIIAFKRKVQE